MTTRTVPVALLGCVALQFAHPCEICAQEAIPSLRSQKSLPSLTLAEMAAPETTPTAARVENRESGAETERVIVTGSYIPVPTAAEVGPNPVQTIDRYTIDKSGERSAEQLIRNLPVANANGVPISGNAGMLE